jgi:hypothetical protein
MYTVVRYSCSAAIAMVWSFRMEVAISDLEVAEAARCWTTSCVTPS